MIDYRDYIEDEEPEEEMNKFVQQWTMENDELLKSNDKIKGENENGI